MEVCFHCGDDCRDQELFYQQKVFCCQGCKTVFEILNDHDLSYYYDLEQTPGTSPLLTSGKFDFLDNQGIAAKLLEFDEQDTQIVSFVVPSIHCSSCIWILENLGKLHAAISASQVNFPEKTIRITFDSTNISLKELVILLCRIGYEPHISLEDFEQKNSKQDRSLLYKLGVAGFAFGNIMFLSFPEYFDLLEDTIGETEFWLQRFKHIFRWIMFVFSLPVVFYAAQSYFIAAYKGLRSKILNIDVPIALGITVLFVRSMIEIMMDWGSGFFDSLAGLVFFLLLGKFFQQKTYAFLSFERDYKSYFPIAVTKIVKNNATGGSAYSEEQVQVYELQKGDRILIRNQELLPVDGMLLKGIAMIDYSFVTGEAEPVVKQSGEMLFAGGRQQSGSIEVEVLKTVTQSYLTQLWSHEVFSKEYQTFFETLTDKISKKFTITIITIAFIAALFWVFWDASKALDVFTAVLIIACPCAIALAAPFTLGNLLRYYGRYKFYLKDSTTLERMASVDTVVFDKTGTLTTNTKNAIIYEGITLTKDEELVLSNTLRASNHPLSRALYDMLATNDICTLDDFEEEVGKGIIGRLQETQVKIGAYDFVYEITDSSETIIDTPERTAVHISSNKKYKGCYVFSNHYREGITAVFEALAPDQEFHILSGDNAGEKAYLASHLPKKTTLLFNQQPEDKLHYIKNLQEQGKTVMMVGDGLNDAGALAQSNVGVVISENINVFSPACDGIMDASVFKKIPQFLALSQKGIQIIKAAFIGSLLYNLIGLGFAISGTLSPVIAAILMPLSSISIVVFTSISTYFLSKKLQLV